MSTPLTYAEREAQYAMLRGVAICPACRTEHPLVCRDRYGSLRKRPWSMTPRCKEAGCHAVLMLPERTPGP